MWTYIYLETGCNSEAVMICVLSVQLNFKDLELILWVQIKLYGAPCPSTAATARHICCSGIWSLSASWSETTSTPAAIYHGDKDRACVFMWQREKERESYWEGEGIAHMRLCSDMTTGKVEGRRREEAAPAVASEAFSLATVTKRGRVLRTQWRHPSAPIHSPPPHTGPVWGSQISNC